MGVMGLDARRCFLSLLRLRSLLGFFCAYSGGRTWNAWAGGWRGGAGASVRKRHESSKSSPKRSSSEMKDDGVLRAPSEKPDGHDGYAHDEPRLELEDSTE
jgi:hypothetical protein